MRLEHSLVDPPEVVLTHDSLSGSTPLIVRVAGVPKPEVTDAADVPATADPTTLGPSGNPPPTAAAVSSDAGASTDSTDAAAVLGLDLFAVTAEGIADAQLHLLGKTASEAVHIATTEEDQLLAVVLDATVAATDDPVGRIDLLALHGASVCRVASIAVRRSTEASVRFAGADEAGALTLEIDDDTLDVNVPLITEHLTEPLTPDPRADGRRRRAPLPVRRDPSRRQAGSDHRGQRDESTGLAGAPAGRPARSSCPRRRPSPGSSRSRGSPTSVPSSR